MPRRDRTGLTATQRRQYDKYLDSIGALNYQGGGLTSGAGQIPSWILNPERRVRDRSVEPAATPPVAQTPAPTPVVPATVNQPTPPTPTPAPSAPAYEDIRPAVRALLPYFSDPDRRNLESFYGVQSDIANGPTDRRYLTSQERATNALNALNAINPSGVKGPGFQFLEQAINLLKQYGGAGADAGMSSANFATFSKEMNALINKANATPTLTPYTTLASMFAFPGGLSMNRTRNTRLFT